MSLLEEPGQIDVVWVRPVEAVWIESVGAIFADERRRICTKPG